MHTKGPWRVMDLGDGYRIVAEAEDKQIIASIYFRDDETPANARLIAAAPELLEALEGAIENTILLIEYAKPIYDENGYSLTAMSEAIRKAKSHADTLKGG